MNSEDANPTGDIDLAEIPPDQILGAVAAARKAIREHPDSAEAYLQLGIALRSGGEIQQAHDAIEHVLSLNPHLSNAWLQKGLISINGGTLKEATVYFRNAVEADPQNIPARLELSAMLFRAGDFLGARQQVEAVLRIDPNNASALAAWASFSCSRETYRPRLRTSARPSP